MFKPRERSARQGGFTLIELIIVISIIGILATIALPSLRMTPRRAKEAVLRADLWAFRDTIDQYYADKGHYPGGISALVDDGYLRSVPVDPITGSADTWIEVFDEPDPEETPAETDLPEDGAPGVIDVKSGAPGSGLNGVPYSEW